MVHFGIGRSLICVILHGANDSILIKHASAKIIHSGYWFSGWTVLFTDAIDAAVLDIWQIINYTNQHTEICGLENFLKICLQCASKKYRAGNNMRGQSGNQPTGPIHT